MVRPAREASRLIRRGPQGRWWFFNAVYRRRGEAAGATGRRFMT
jgi:hypothetical protein